MAKITLKDSSYTVNVSQTLDEVLDKLNEANQQKAVGITLGEIVHPSLPEKRISIRVDQIIFIRE